MGGATPQTPPSMPPASPFTRNDFDAIMDMLREIRDAFNQPVPAPQVNINIDAITELLQQILNDLREFRTNSGTTANDTNRLVTEINAHLSRIISMVEEEEYEQHETRATDVSGEDGTVPQEDQRQDDESAASTPVQGDRICPFRREENDPSASKCTSCGERLSPTTTESVIVPNVLGQIADDASNNLYAAMLRAGEIKKVFFLEEHAGCVISQNPSAGDTVSTDSPVNLWVAVSRPEDSDGLTVVPNVVNLNWEEADTLIQNAGLYLGAVDGNYSATIPNGMVIAQNQKARTIVRNTTLVDITISLGPEEDQRQDDESAASETETSATSDTTDRVEDHDTISSTGSGGSTIGRVMDEAERGGGLAEYQRRCGSALQILENSGNGLANVDCLEPLFEGDSTGAVLVDHVVGLIRGIGGNEYQTADDVKPDFISLAKAFVDFERDADRIVFHSVTPLSDLDADREEKEIYNRIEKLQKVLGLRSIKDLEGGDYNSKIHEASNTVGETTPKKVSQVIHPGWLLDLPGGEEVFLSKPVVYVE